MLNVGPLELLVVLAVALIVVGPERLPGLARSVGRALRQFRDVQDEVRELVSAGVDDEMREAASEFRQATGDLRRATDVKGAARSAQRSIREEVGPKTDRPTPPRRRPVTAADGGEAGEAGGAPAERLVEDPAAVEHPAAAPDPEPTTAPDTEPDAPTGR